MQISDGRMMQRTRQETNAGFPQQAKIVADDSLSRRAVV